MSWLDGLSHRIRTLLAPNRHALELEEEVQFHLDLDTMQSGDPVESRHRFGNRSYYREETRAATWLRAVDRLTDDIRAAWRSVRRAPGVVAVITLALTLGIGVNATAFSLLDAVYLRAPSGVSDPSALRRYWVEHTRTGTGVPFHSSNIGHPYYRIIAELSGHQDNVTTYMPSQAPLGPGLDGPTANVVYAAANYANVLGIRTSAGRFYSPEEDRLGAGAPVAVISDAFRRRHLGDGSSPVGASIDLAGRQYTIIGVFEPAFSGLDLQAADVWLPLGGWSGRPQWWDNPYAGNLQVIERAVDPAVELTAAQRATDAVRRYNRERLGAAADTMMRIYLGPIQAGQKPGQPRTDVLISTRLVGIAVLVLIVALANVINLLLARGLARRQELSVRLALGLSRPRLIGVLTLETMLIAGVAGSAAALAGWAGGGALRRLLLPEISWEHSAFDWRVGALTAGLTLITGLIAGIVPALHASRPALMGTIKGGGPKRPRSFLRNSLVMTQAALSLALMAGATLSLRSLRNVTTLDLGYEADGLVFGEIRFESGTAPAASVQDAGLTSVATRLADRPGVISVARSNMPPMHGIGVPQYYVGADSGGSFPIGATMLRVSPSFFDVTGLSLLQGRGFAEHGTGGEIVINQAMARMIWPDVDPLRQCMQVGSRANPCYTIVGVVETSRMGSVIEPEPMPQYYMRADDPLAESIAGIIIVRAEATRATAVRDALDAELRQAFPTGYPRVTSMTGNLEPQYRPWRVGAILFSGVGLLAMAVTLLGIYSTVSFSVEQRTREFGIRMALGAQQQTVVRQVITEGLRTVAIGVVAGIILVLAAGRLLRALLYGIEPDDPTVVITVSFALIAIAGLAAFLPAWRASRIDPAETLRTD